jgi:hypothetical protein
MRERLQTDMRNRLQIELRERLKTRPSVGLFCALPQGLMSVWLTVKAVPLQRQKQELDYGSNKQK